MMLYDGRTYEGLYCPIQRQVQTLAGSSLPEARVIACLPCLSKKARADPNRTERAQKAASFFSS
jgi:hypothetical protein